MKRPTKHPVVDRGEGRELAGRAIADLTRLLCAGVEKASKGGRPSFLVRWARRVGVERLAETTLSAIIPTLWARPPGRRVAQEIMTALGDVAGEEIDELTSSQRATLGWSLLVAATVSVRTPDGLPAISLSLDTTFRTRRGRLTKRDQYHVSAVESRMTGLEADPDSTRLLIPREILRARPEGGRHLAAHGRRCYEGDESPAEEDAMDWVESQRR